MVSPGVDEDLGGEVHVPEGRGVREQGLEGRVEEVPSPLGPDAACGDGAGTRGRLNLPARQLPANPLSALSRWKLFDNLRRSLVPAATVALLVLGWLFSPAPLAWTAWLLSLWALPVLLPALRDVFAWPVDMPLETHLVQVGRSSLRQLQRAVVNVACLPYEAFFSVDAILRTLWRLLVTRRHLLQWNPSSEVERSLGGGMRAELLGMAPAPLIATAITALLAMRQPAALWVAAPLLLLWLVSPAVMAWLGRPTGQRTEKLSVPQLAFLGTLSRRTWAFFETYVRAEDHWLPPDNVQEHPALVVARRTSPTNIGLSLLATIAAAAAVSGPLLPPPSSAGCRATRRAPSMTSTPTGSSSASDISSLLPASRTASAAASMLPPNFLAISYQATALGLLLYCA